jgi:hypothetical protein
MTTPESVTKIAAEYSATYEKSIKSQIDFLKNSNTMTSWLLGISGATIIFGFKDHWAQQPKLFVPALIVFGIQIFFAIIHRIYNDSHTSYLNQRIDYINLQATLIQHELKFIASYTLEKRFFGLYNDIANLKFLNDIEMSGLQTMDSNLKFTKRALTAGGITVIVTALLICGLFLYVLTLATK